MTNETNDDRLAALAADAEQRLMIAALNTFNAAELSQQLIQQLDLAATATGLSLTNNDWGFTAISTAAVPMIATLIQDLIAHTIATLIDAGSERDAVNESDELRTAICTELHSWDDHAAGALANDELDHIDNAIRNGAI